MNAAELVHCAFRGLGVNYERWVERVCRRCPRVKSAVLLAECMCVCDARVVGSSLAPTCMIAHQDRDILRRSLESEAVVEKLHSTNRTAITICVVAFKGCHNSSQHNTIPRSYSIQPPPPPHHSHSAQVLSLLKSNPLRNAVLPD